MKHLKVLARARWKVVDFLDSRYYSVYTVSVLKPTHEYPVACVSLSIVKGNQRYFDRFSGVDTIRQVIIIPSEYIERLELSYKEALRQAEYIREQQKAYHKMSNLQPGGMVVRTDTGEVIAEAEKLLGLDNDNRYT